MGIKFGGGSMRRCGNCNGSVGDDDEYCRHCGANFSRRRREKDNMEWKKLNI